MGHFDIDIHFNVEFDFFKLFSLFTHSLFYVLFFV